MSTSIRDMDLCRPITAADIRPEDDNSEDNLAIRQYYKNRHQENLQLSRLFPQHSASFLDNAACYRRMLVRELINPVYAPLLRSAPTDFTVLM